MPRKHDQQIIWHGPSDLTFYGNRATGVHAVMIEAQLVADGLITEKELIKQRRANPELPPTGEEPDAPTDKPRRKPPKDRPQQKRRRG